MSENMYCSVYLVMYHAATDNGPVTIDTTNVPKYICFNVRLITLGMSLNVGAQFWLSLLLKCSRLNIVKLLLTKQQIVDLKNNKINQNVRYTVTYLNAEM
jgi:hypothetical protein